MRFIRRGIVAATLLLLLLTTFQSFAITTVFFDVQTVFTTQSPNSTNRVFRMQALSPFAGSYFYATSDVAGQFYVSNVLATTYSGQMLAPPNSLTFSFYVNSTNLGVVPAQNITSLPANTVQTYPAGQTAYSAQASDARYAFSTNGPGAGINGAQATNIASGLIAATNATYSSIIYTNPVQIMMTNLLPGLTNGHVTSSITNGLASVTLLNTTSNLLQTQIGSAGVSAITATNIATNQVFLATNGIRVATGLSAFAPTNQFDATGAGATAATAATNGIGIASGLSGMVSTNRFDVSGAAAAVLVQSNTKMATNTGTSFSQTLINPVSANFTNIHSFKASYPDFYDDNSGLMLFTNTVGQYMNVDLSDSSLDFIGISGGITQITFDNILTGPEVDSPAFHLTQNSASLQDRFSAGIVFGDRHADLTTITNHGIYYGDISGASNLLAIGISTNGSTANQTMGSVGGRTVWTNAAQLLGTSYTNGFVDKSITNGLASITSVNTTSNSLQSQITAGGINAVTGTNIANFQIGLSNAFLIASNALLFVAKVDKTNGFSTGEQATNLATFGNLSFGQSGLATNIVGGTNVIKFINAGSPQATNASFKWIAGLNLYTNWLNGGIYTNNGSAWLMITNGVTLYSLSGSSPIGQMSAVSGALPAPLAVSSFEFDHNGMADVGFFSITNFNTISNGIVTNVVTITTNNFIASLNGIGNGTSLTNPVLTFVNAPFGTANTISGGLAYDATLSGRTNSITAGNDSVIAGGQKNIISGGSSFDTIGGGLSNSIASGTSFIGGGQGNSMALNYNTGVIDGGFFNLMSGSGSVSCFISGGQYNLITPFDANGTMASGILGGQSNIVKNVFDTAMGRNVTITNYGVLSWSDGTPDTSTVNSQARLVATNGLFMRGPITIGPSAMTNSGIYYYSNSALFSLFGVTNNMPNFAYWTGVSNGVLVTIFFSNGVPAMKNNWP